MNCIYIVHSADVYDAMLNKRVYHEPFILEEVFEELDKDGLVPDNVLMALKKYSLYRKKKDRDKKAYLE